MGRDLGVPAASQREKGRSVGPGINCEKSGMKENLIKYMQVRGVFLRGHRVLGRRRRKA